MPQNIMNAPVEKLDRVYICTKCGMAFLFRSDIDDHAASMDHGEVLEAPL